MLNKLTETIRRATTITRIAAAARKTSATSGDERIAAQRALASLLADAKGIPMKIGQFMAESGEGDTFAPLTSGVEPVAFERIQIEIEAALGGPLGDTFAAMEPVGIAASLGQVHRATLKSGETVAVKVRYPEIVSAVEAELRLAHLLPGLGPVRTWGFDLESYKRVLSDDLHAELDYRGECQRQQDFLARMNITGLVIPRTYPEFTAENLLVQSWEEGLPLASIGHWPGQDRLKVGLILMCTLFQSLFHHGEIHGDPHSGNYRYRRNSAGAPEVVLLDFGCTIPIERGARLGLLKLILGAIENDETDPMACFAAMGFDPAKLQHMETLLPALSRILLEPFTSPINFQIHTWDLRNRVDRLLGELKWWFRSAGPANLLLLLRAFRGLIAQLQILGVSQSWLPVLMRVVDPALCEEARRLELPSRPKGSGPTAGFRALAQYLRVKVCENGHPIVAITFPASQTIFLEDLIPDETLARIQAANIDLVAIRVRAASNGLRPQELFTFEDGERNYRVWLE